jgi:hypothetical protein
MITTHMITTHIITTFSDTECCYAECDDVELSYSDSLSAFIWRVLNLSAVMLSVVMMSVIKVNAASAFEQVSIMAPSGRKKLLIMHPTSCREPGAVFTKLYFNRNLRVQ